MKSPCQYCKDRNPGCHSVCEKYIEFRKKCDHVIAIKQKENNAIPDISKEIKKIIHKNMKGK